MFTLVQLTDTHIALKGDRNYNRLSCLINHIKSQGPVDGVIVSGDLADDGGQGLEPYHLLRDLLGQLEIPYYIIPGNHDDRTVMRQAFHDFAPFDLCQESLHYVINQPQWPISLVALDTLLPGHYMGSLDPRQIQWIGETVAAQNKPVIIAMHHPPLTVNTLPSEVLEPLLGISEQFLKILDFEGADEFADFVNQSPSLQAILCGHNHLAFQMPWHGTNLVISPSSAPLMPILMEFKTQLESLGIVVKPDPGYAIHQWDDESQKLKSEFVWVPEIE